MITGTNNVLKIDGDAAAATADCDFFDAAAGVPQFIMSGATMSLAQVQAIGFEKHGKAGDPHFANAASGDYSLRAGSPAVNLVPAAGIVGISADIQGKKRPAGAAFDAGAFEMQK